MLVVFDATEFCADFHLTGIAWRVFLSGFRRVGLEPCIPESVIDEVNYVFREKLREATLEAKKVWKQVIPVVGVEGLKYVPKEEEIKRLRSECATRLTALINDNGFLMFPYPDIPHKDMVTREFANLKPFREKIGYRDALLWYAILQNLREQRQPIVFVTANSQDFGKNKLHPDFVQDLHAIGLTKEHVRIFHHLNNLNQALILPTLQDIDGFGQIIQEGTGPFSIEKWVIKELPALLYDDPGIGPLEPGHGSCRFSSIKQVNSIDLDAVRQIDSDQVLVSATADIEGTVDIDASWNDYESYADVRDFFDSEDEPFSYVSAEVPMRFKIAFTLILSTKSWSVLSSELDGYESDFGYSVEINPHLSESPSAVVLSRTTGT